MQSTYNTAFAILLYKVPLSFCPSFLKLKKKTEYESFDFLLSSSCIRKKIQFPSFFLIVSTNVLHTKWKLAFGGVVFVWSCMLLTTGEIQLQMCVTVSFGCTKLSELQANQKWWDQVIGVVHVSGSGLIAKCKILNLLFLLAHTHMYTIKPLFYCCTCYFSGLELYASYSPPTCIMAFLSGMPFCILFNYNSKGVATWHLLYP